MRRDVNEIIEFRATNLLNHIWMSRHLLIEFNPKLRLRAVVSVVVGVSILTNTSLFTMN